MGDLIGTYLNIGKVAKNPSPSRMRGSKTLKKMDSRLRGNDDRESLHESLLLECIRGYS
jgi:hypothetical protein